MILPMGQKMTIFLSPTVAWRTVNTLHKLIAGGWKRNRIMDSHAVGFSSSTRRVWPHILLLPAVLLASGLFLAACTDNPKRPEPPMSFPFDTQKAGFKIETDFRVTEFNSYTLSFKLGYREGDAVDRERVRKLAGGPARDRAGALLKSGVAIRLRIRINALIPSDLEHAYDKEILEQRLHSSGDASFGTTIADVKLKPGTYRLMIENLEVIQELHGTAITLLVATDPKSTFRSD